MSWNPVLNIVKQIKQDYVKMFDSNNLEFEQWLEALGDERYDEIFEPLQVNQMDEFILVRYGLAEMQRGFWEDPTSIYRECRSVVIDLKNEAIVLAPYKKFFNLNEVEENSTEAVRERFMTAKVVEVAEKLDGSMQMARWYNGDVFMTGSMALDRDQSWRLEHGRQLLNSNYINMLRENPNITFTFEYVSPDNLHVVTYEQEDEGLHLIGARVVDTGQQLTYSTIQQMALIYGVIVVDTVNITLDEMLEEMKVAKANEKEGWIINLDGHLIKIKCDDYVFIHRVLDRTSSINVIIESIAENEYDDLLSKVPSQYKDRIQTTADSVFIYLGHIEREVSRMYSLAPKGSRKEFMVWVDNNVSSKLRSYVRNTYLKKDLDILRKGKQGYKKMSEIVDIVKECLEIVKGDYRLLKNKILKNEI